uniref:Aminotransferase-like plant mobile domain-containing protein n=1 Tax=Hordeum vulgare subsp. vulgare TaxID=112509 RepID=A0A8I6Y0P9_HORVV
MDEDDERGCLEGGRQDSTVYCDGVQQALEDPEDQTALTSRLSVKHVVEVMQKFDDYKRWLVSEIGFEGMLNLPRSGKIDLRMSAWIMRKVKVKSRTIVIDKERVLLFALEDFHKIFGVPCGNRVVRGRDGEIKNTTIEFMKQTIGMNASPAHNLKVAENFITRDISEESSKIEKDCFQISFVIFVMGYVLSPGTKHEYMTIDFWGALANAELISQFNWCEYAVDNLMSAVMKVQTEYNNKAGTIHMSGCHLFFQIFLLDNIDLGIFNMRHPVFPRVQCFNQKRLRQMITMAQCKQRGVLTYVLGAVRPPDSVCYTRVVAMSHYVQMLHRWCLHRNNQYLACP